MKKKHFIIIISWAAVLACMGIIFFLSAQDGGESSDTSSWLWQLLKLPVSESFLRTAAHFLEFTGLAVLVFNALYRTFGYIRPYLSFAVSSAYAATDEFHQLFVDGRACTLSDWLVDSLGAASGIIVLCVFVFICSKIKRRRFN